MRRTHTRTHTALPPLPRPSTRPMTTRARLRTPPALALVSVILARRQHGRGAIKTLYLHLPHAPHCTSPRPLSGVHYTPHSSVAYVPTPASNPTTPIPIPSSSLPTQLPPNNQLTTSPARRSPAAPQILKSYHSRPRASPTRQSVSQSPRQTDTSDAGASRRGSASAFN
ncbi:hypothetical protein FB451DRAFT_1225764 [Mycena latifolia]|nr:hypothetical protein FB451DRAFT_1225764 [Mycena latifolia]